MQLAALRQHFPDHLKGFRDILAEVRGPEGQLLYNFEDEEEKEEEEDAAITEAGGASSVLLDQEFDDLLGSGGLEAFLEKSMQVEATEHSNNDKFGQLLQRTVKASPSPLWSLDSVGVGVVLLVGVQRG